MNGYIVLLTDDQRPWVMSDKIRIRSLYFPNSDSRQWQPFSPQSDLINISRAQQHCHDPDA